jgi:hypothetical protein
MSSRRLYTLAGTIHVNAVEGKKSHRFRIDHAGGSLYAKNQGEVRMLLRTRLGQRV